MIKSSAVTGLMLMIALLVSACATKPNAGDIPPPLIFIGNSVLGKSDKPRPTHGNWCGPAYPDDAGIARMQPICARDPTDAGCTLDDLDFACMVHDLCYRQYGPACACDQQLTDYLLQGRALNDPSVKAEFGGKLLKVVKVVGTKRCTGGCKSIKGVVTCEK